jgi:hypothetical protein
MSKRINQPPKTARASLWMILLLGAAPMTFATTIDFEAQCPSGVQASGPCSQLFSTVGNAESLSISTPAGSVLIQGGALFDQITNLPADETALYGTAGNAANIGVHPASGFTNPLLLTFPSPITSFSLDILNGNIINVDYHLADNKGNSADFVLIPNLSGGTKTVGFAATGNVVTISAASGQIQPGGMTWDFLIDNIQFTTAGNSAVPEPTTVVLIGVGLTALGLIRRKGGPGNV